MIIINPWMLPPVVAPLGDGNWPIPDCPYTGCVCLGLAPCGCVTTCPCVTRGPIDGCSDISIEPPTGR